MERGSDKAVSLLLAVGVHLVAAALMLLGLSFNKPVELGGDAPLQAVMVDMSLLQALPKPAPAPPRPAPPPPAPQPEPAAATPPPPAAEPAPQIIEDQAALRRQSELAAEQAAQAERLRIQAERERIEKEKQREAERLKELEKVRAEREQAEAKRREEARKLEAVRQQQVRDAAERQAAEAAAAQAAAASRQADSLLNQYAALIQQVVTENWRRPPNTPPGIRCTLNVRQIPGGEVIGVTIGRPCNATGAVQQSILDAVERASPLPYSGFERVFERNLQFDFYYNG